MLSRNDCCSVLRRARRDGHFVAEVYGDALDFALDLGLDVAAFRADRLYGRVGGQVAVLEIGLAARDVGFAVTQTAHGLRIDGVADGVQRRAGHAQLLQLAVARFALGQVGLRLQHLLLDVADLLFHQRRALRRHQAGLDAEGLRRAFLGLHILAQFREAARQPGIGALGGVDALVHLAGDVDVGVGVGDQLRAVRIGRVGGDLDDIGQAAAATSMAPARLPAMSSVARVSSPVR